MDDETGVNEMNDGYESSSAEKPEPVDESPAVEATPVVEVKPDPLQELAARFEQLEQRTRKAESHIGGLNENQRLIRDTLEASKAQKVEAAPTQNQVQDAIESPAEWDELKAEFPEWASGMEKYMDARLKKAPAVDVDSITTRITAAEQRALAAEARAEKIEQSSAKRELSRLVPDWQDRNTTEFFGWLNQQTDEVKSLASSWEPEDAAKVYRLHESSTKKPEPSKAVNTRQKRIEAAVTPKGTGGFTPSRSEIDEMESGYSRR